LVCSMRITLVAGLPGSGKSTLAKQVLQQGGFLLDDPVRPDEIDGFTADHVVICDINLCVHRVRQAALAQLHKRYPGATIEWIFFENDPEACLVNVMARNDGRVVHDAIGVMSLLYTIPEGMAPIPVYKVSN
jgi:hypothetical protein